MIPKSLLHISEEVRDALQNRKAIVALESTIIAHGMPWPRNVEVANELENIVRKEGAIPATIAILDGKICIGLHQEQIELLGKAKDVWKVSIRDLPYVISQKLNGATTVASTLRLASMAGIRIFATGGTGGVHRGAETTFDVSADLTEMSQSGMGIISAGVKSILDIGLTLEKLETLGIPVVTFGSDEFPGFYSRQSGFRSPLRLDSPAEIARMLNIKWELNLMGSVLIANPIPLQDEIPSAKMEIFIHEALKDAATLGITGKKLTPFLLKAITEKSGGKSLEANISLVKNNVRLGAWVARDLAAL